MEVEDTEANLLGCVFADETADVISRCIEAGITDRDFTAPRCALVYKAMAELNSKGLAVDMVSVAEYMMAKKVIPSAVSYHDLAQLDSSKATTMQASLLIERVKTGARVRAMTKAAMQIVESSEGASADPEAFFTNAEKLIGAAADQQPHAIKDTRAVLKDVLGLVDTMMKRKGEPTGVRSGFLNLDRLTWGFQKQELIILAARPSMGKTALALNFAEAAVLPKGGKPVPTLIFSLEMSAKQLLMRMLCSRAEINLHRLREGLAMNMLSERATMDMVSEEIANAPLHIDDSSDLNAVRMRSIARRMAKKYGIGLIIVDYLQLMLPVDPKMPREQQVAESSRNMKAMAKELNVPVIVLSQLNRAGEKENRQPKLADLRDSGSIEQDADTVFMLARPADADERYQVAGDVADLIVAKQRNGPVGEVRLSFNRGITRFEQYNA
jgi:replicative DNA helicase